MPRQGTPDLDLSTLYDLSVEQPTLTKQASSHRLKFADHPQRFVRAAFDLFRDNNSEFLWRLEKDSETGEEFIVRTAMTDPVYTSSPGWSAECDSNKIAITLIYKGHAVRAFKKADLNFTNENVDEWRKYLLDKISTDPAFVKQIVQSMSSPRKKILEGKCPELFK